jgi:membrane protein
MQRVESSSRPGGPATPYPDLVHPLTQTIIDRSPARLRGPVTAIVRTVDGAMSDRLPGLAAEIAFWVLLSLPSLLLTAIAAASLVIEGQAWEAQLVDRVVEVSSVALTGATIQSVVVPVLQQLLEGGGPTLVSFAFIVALWTASRAVRVVLTTIAIVSRRGAQRRGWQDRLLGFAVTLGALLVGSILAPLLVAGPNFGDQLVSWLGTDLVVLADIWRAAYWPSVILLATLALAVIYHLGVPGRSKWRHDWPGAVLAAAVWLAGSAGLRLYGLWVVDGESAYGPLAGPIVALLWLWLTGFAVLLGAQLNAQFERVWAGKPAERSLDETVGRQGGGRGGSTTTRAEADERDPTVVLADGPSRDDRTVVSSPDGSGELEERDEPEEPEERDESERSWGRSGSRAVSDPPDASPVRRS